MDLCALPLAQRDSSGAAASASLTFDPASWGWRGLQPNLLRGDEGEFRLEVADPLGLGFEPIEERGDDGRIAIGFRLRHNL